MTALKYLVESKIGSNSEIIALKRDHPKDFDTLVQWAREEMAHNGIEITEPEKK